MDSAHEAKLPLQGWRVLVPRTPEQAAPMVARLAGYGATAELVPTIAVLPPVDPEPLKLALEQLAQGRFEWAVFTSVNAVSAVDAQAWAAMKVAAVKVAAVGEKTAQALRELGVEPQLLPPAQRQNSEGLVGVFPACAAARSVLLPRADIGTQVLPQGLRALGWDVHEVEAYRTVPAELPPPQVREALTSGVFDAAVFTSGSTVRNLVERVGKPHERTVIGCIGPATRQVAQSLGLRVDVVPLEADAEALIDALAAYAATLTNNQLLED